MQIKPGLDAAYKDVVDDLYSAFLALSDDVKPKH